MNLLKSVYKIFRSIIMSVIMLLVVAYIGLYVVLSVPSVQNKMKEVVCGEISAQLGGALKIEKLSIRPFSEVILTNVKLYSPGEEECASIKKVAAGIDLWRLLKDWKVVLNYAEILGLTANIDQPLQNAPFNIQFLIDALSSKDKKEPEAKFDFKIRNVVVRDSRVLISRPWMAELSGIKQRMSEIDIKGLRIDMSIPMLSNNEFRFDIRNIQFDASPLFDLRSLSAKAAIVKDTLGKGDDRLVLKDISLSLPNTVLSLGNFDLRLNSIVEIPVNIDGYITPSDFSGLLSTLDSFRNQWDITVKGKINDIDDIELSEFRLDESETNSSLKLIGRFGNIGGKDSINVELESLKADFSSKLIREIISHVPTVNERAMRIAESAGRVGLEIEGILKNGDIASVSGSMSSERGDIEFEGVASGLKRKIPKIRFVADVEDLALDKLLDTDKVGMVSLNMEADISGIDKNAEGRVKISSTDSYVLGNYMTDVDLDLKKDKEKIEVSLNALSDGTMIGVDGKAVLAGSATRLDADLVVSGLKTSRLGMKGKLKNCEFSGRLQAHTLGNNWDNLTGRLLLRDFNVSRSDGKNLKLSQLDVVLDSLNNGVNGSDDQFARDLRLESDWVNARLYGDIHPKNVLKDMQWMIGSIFPTLLPGYNGLQMQTIGKNDFSYEINIEGVSAPYVFFDTQVRPLTDIPIKGKFDAKQGKADLDIVTPHLQHGKNKLIRDVKTSLHLDAFLGQAMMKAGLIFPAKKGDAQLDVVVDAIRDKVRVDVGLNPTLESVVKGNMAFQASFSRLPDPYKPVGELAVGIDVIPSSLSINDKAWFISESEIDYSGRRISVNDFKISHDDQFIRIQGTASESEEDEIAVSLNDIDLEYIFNILNINYVSFGGMATGNVTGNRLLTKTPEAHTEYLHVKGLSYNGTVLGDGDLASDYDAGEQMVGIFGVIRDPLTRERKVNVEGGIWVTRDSLSFGFDADKVNVGIMKPFVSAFCSDLYGEATGKCKLYGTFSDIDMEGDLKADTLSMKLDFTNTWYHAGNDSVFLHKGTIEIPPLTLYDDEGHTAEFSGWLRHSYFHNPVFNFRLRDANSLLCYNTNEKMNPLWYGTIYGSGNAQINGSPGIIDIDMNMTTDEDSKFYYIISDTEDVAQYNFLTFTDKKKEALRFSQTDSVPDYLKKFKKQTEQMESQSSNVILSIKGTVTNDALVTLVMDPKAGDNITARGQGALQMDYNLANNDLRMIGTYVLDEGNYNFTLQDIIIKNFNIKKGSQIKFDGNPMNAVLDIAATYRVNTNLTDLDKSFSTDKELNRTNVPVDAVLKVDGPMTNPDITFDIELPTLTSDVERKVKSLVSTNDMMSRQIIYLLALNRFYTPEYTGGQSTGAEWSSMASSTISSQLSNILSQMTDKLDVSPSFRSDKGDFTDMEFDLALSSRLLNNRLLINGNFGYRDKSTSNTQFIGDFDIEYLLNKNGNLRLKAYNHFNDQNYYLRSALTTQGVGVVFRRDFDRLFIRKKEERSDEKNDEQPATENDSDSEGMSELKEIEFDKYK